MSALAGVLDSTGIIGLAKGQVFERLAGIYQRLYVPSAVRKEIIQQGQGRPGAGELTAALGTWVIEVLPAPHLLSPFAALRSPADRAVLAVAHDPALAIHAPHCSPAGWTANTRSRPPPQAARPDSPGPSGIGPYAAGRVRHRINAIRTGATDSRRMARPVSSALWSYPWVQGRRQATA